MKNRKTGYNSTYKKLAVQWLNGAFCFVSSSVLADSLVLRNRQLLIAAKRYTSFSITSFSKAMAVSISGSVVYFPTLKRMEA